MLGTVGASLLAPQLQLFVAADEWNEAAFGGEAVVKSNTMVCQLNWELWFYGRCATERSLVPLVSCYEQLQLRSEQEIGSAHV